MKTKVNLKLIAGVAGLNFTFSTLAAGDSAVPDSAANTTTPGGATTVAPAANVTVGNASPASAAEVEELKKQIDELDQKIRILEREREIDQDNAAEIVKSQPKIIMGPGGFSMSTADSNFVAELHGVLQWDSRSFFQDGGNNGTDGFLLRRARPIFSGTVFHDFDFNFTPDFGGSTVQVVDAYMNYRYNSAFQLEAGKFKAPVGLEALVADRDTLFNERSLATDLVPNRDLGAMLHGNVMGGAISYGIGVFDGATDYNGTTVNSPFEDDKAFEGRMFFQPWINTGVNALRGLGFGVAGTYMDNHPATNSATGLTPGYTTDGQQKFFSYNAGVNAAGAAWRISPQVYYYYGPLGILGEYVISDQQVASATKSADLDNTAWEVTGSWVLTGEDASYNGVTPRHPFDPRNGDWGAWQLVARYAGLNVDSKAFDDGFASSTKSADGANAWSVGLNWYLNRNVRADLSFTHTVFSGFTGKAAPGVVPAQAENVLFSRIQLAF
jgi:phosphate-selective porin OprO/OprP